MRPLVLNPLFAALSALPGIGPKLEKLFSRLLARDGEHARVIDLLFHLPTGFVDRRNQPKLSEVVPDTVVTVAVTVDRHRPPPPNRPRAPYNIDASDDTNTLMITYFNARRDYLEKLYPEGALRYVSGTATLYDGHLQMVHPDRVVDAAGFASLPLIDPVYPLTEGLHPTRCARRSIARSIACRRCRNGRMRHWLKRNGFPELRRRVARAASPRGAGRTSSREAPRGRGSLMTSCWRASSRSRSFAPICARAPAAAAPPRACCAHASSRALPYALTPSQTRAVADIVADLAQPERMLRLLQGDVGSGKTVVALARRGAR